MKRRIATAITAGLAIALIVAPGVSAAANTVTVTGNTSAGENQPGWLFNRDVTSMTPYEFNTNESSIGAGSLYVKPINNTLGTPGARDKFVAENFLRTPVADVNSIAYDFQIAGTGTSADADQFYLNVYANIDNTTKFYDCRYDYVPTTGSTTAFSTATFIATDTPVNVQKSGTGRLATCPATLAEMPAGSHVRAFSISVGDTSASDTGLAGYLDKIVVDAAGNVTTYDFEPVLSPATKDDCKNGGWATFNTPVFKNQGECVSSVASKGKSQGNSSSNGPINPIEAVVNFVRTVAKQ